MRLNFIFFNHFNLLSCPGFYMTPPPTHPPKYPKGLAKSKNYIDFWVKKVKFLGQKVKFSERRGLRPSNPLLFNIIIFFFLLFPISLLTYFIAFPLPQSLQRIALHLILLPSWKISKKPQFFLHFYPIKRHKFFKI